MSRSQPRLRLLPDRPEIGWTPYAWLVYLAAFWIFPAQTRASAGEWVVTAAASVVFLALYFWGYHLRGRRILLAVAGIAALGLGLGPFNPGASVFFVYAAAFLGHAGPVGFAARCLLAVAGLAPLESWLLGLSVYFWLPAMVFSLLVGAINIHFARYGRTQAALRRSQEEVERLAKLAERERIARDLHDLLGHTLTVILRKAELATRLAGSEPERAAAEMRAVEEVARRALREVRSAVDGYRTTDLASELERARVAAIAGGLELVAEVAEVRLDAEREQALALALREAMTNVVRHARAERVEVRLAEAEGRVRLEVRDNGRGGARAEGAGLAGMRERVGALGGTVERDGRRGTTLVVSLPVAERHAPGPARTSAATAVAAGGGAPCGAGGGG